VHAAKGLEWRCVRIVGLEEGVFPSRHAQAEGRLEEERRLAYVAMTRARSELVISWARARRGVEQARSRFVAEATSRWLLRPPPPRRRPPNSITGERDLGGRCNQCGRL
jgi:DNA helicase II / ATP-dependent DNA helicase PcrA